MGVPVPAAAATAYLSSALRDDSKADGADSKTGSSKPAPVELGDGHAAFFGRHPFIESVGAISEIAYRLQSSVNNSPLSFWVAGYVRSFTAALQPAACSLQCADVVNVMISRLYGSSECYVCYDDGTSQRTIDLAFQLTLSLTNH